MEKVTNKEVLSRLYMKTTMLLPESKSTKTQIFLVTSNAMKHLRDTFWS